MIFETPESLAKAFEAGSATALRWQKVLRHVSMHQFEPSTIVSALTSPDHVAVANA